LENDSHGTVQAITKRTSTANSNILFLGFFIGLSFLKPYVENNMPFSMDNPARIVPSKICLHYSMSKRGPILPTC
jgi:hypothetical protein